VETQQETLGWNHNKSECVFTNIPLRKNPSFEVILHTNEDQIHSVQYLHNVKHTKLGHEPCIVCFVTNMDNCFESFLSRVYTSFLEL
jgi:hypothetical protein